MKIFVVDTHALVWFLSNDKRLSPQVGDILESPEVLLLIPTIVLAEITHLYRKGRITQSLEKVWQFLHLNSPYPGVQSGALYKAPLCTPGW